ncbi:MAG: DUF2537 domain-containing protein [Sciscionella sp.]
MELRVSGTRAVLAEGEDEVDPQRLPLGAELSEALQEWARVAVAVRGSDAEAHTASALIAQRGTQLATRIATVMNTEVAFADPLTGGRSVLGPRPRVAQHRARGRATAAPQGEPVPWGVGIGVSALSGFVVLFGMLALAFGLGVSAWWLALLANLVVTAGLAPSVNLMRRLPVWRWVAHGMAIAMVLAWIGWLISLL